LVAGNRATRRGVSARRRVALGGGGVGAFVLGLSVSHCTGALVTTTWAPWVLAALLAVGNECGRGAGAVGGTAAGQAARAWGEGGAAMGQGLCRRGRGVVHAPQRTGVSPACGERLHGAGLRGRGRGPRAGLHPWGRSQQALDGGVR